ncbi:hypothetical protein D9619_011043 [Psilocybe cf. subviscida]|uniref:Uncharacterized protein n=1 Tax=Psilocybe cf. subviscida TaxID=2480587 RepID=A0A8H5F002_9AGAR|nr:hypothetical protein D9619_011043 [Psilocybe cf. subviscida]
MSSFQPDEVLPTFEATFRLQFECILWPTLLQALLAGIYITLFAQTIIPIILRGQQKIYTVILTFLFGAIIFNLVISWIYLRAMTITHDDSRETMENVFFSGFSNRLTTTTNVTCRITIFIADMIVVWRCYTLWARSKILLIMFTPLIATEAVMFLVITIQPIPSSPQIVEFLKLAIPAFYLTSLAITIIATTLIVYRIVSVVRLSEGAESRYKLTLEALVESGGLYAASLLVISILYIARGYGSFTVQDRMVAAGLIWQAGVLPPITGIAPTLIAFRIATGRARDEAAWSQSEPLSFLRFKKTLPTTVCSNDIPSISIITTHNGGSKSQQPGDTIGTLERTSLVQ